MEEDQRWSVTYTNHVKQKRKVYHDGFLVLQSSCSKVMLYDEWDKLLETRFVKKDDLILSGESITFGSYLVDLGELCQGNQPRSVLNSQDRDEKVSETSSSFSSYSSKNFKKSEMNKFGSSPNCMDMTKLSTKEWQVLYTTQITQKAKKFHDGFLQLIVCGSQGRQVKLYDTNRRHLDGRFLKKDEIVCFGESLVLDGHLVDIGEQEEDHKPPTDLNLKGRSCKVAGKSDMVDYQAKIPTNKKFPAGKAPDITTQETLTKLSDSSYKTENAKLSRGDAEPRRSVHDILSILRQPSERKDNPVNKVFTEDCAESHSNNHIKEYSEECTGTAREVLREKVSEHDSVIKVIKSEPVEVVIDAEEPAVSENGRVRQARSSSFHLRPKTVHFISPIHDVQCTNLNKFMPSSSSMESHAAVTAALNSDIQKEIISESPTRSYEYQILENPPNIYSCEEVVTESNAALANGLST